MASACGSDNNSLFAAAGTSGSSAAGAGGNSGKGGSATGGAGGGGAGQGGSTSNGGQPGNGGSGGTSGSGGSGGWGGAGGSGGWAGTGGGTSGAGGGGGSGATAGAGDCASDPVSPPSQGSCVKTGTSGYPCNPVTNAGCNASAGEACDFNGTAFQCFPAPNDVAACGACNTQSGPFCVGGFTCFGGSSHCTRYCCNNADCAPGTACVMQYPTSLGICQTSNPNALSGFTGGGGAGGTGGGGYGGSGGTGGYGGSMGGSGGTGGTACAHGPCQIGGPLDINCDTCASMVCQFTPTCCSTSWDATCVQVAQMFCQCTP